MIIINCIPSISLIVIKDMVQNCTEPLFKSTGPARFVAVLSRAFQNILTIEEIMLSFLKKKWSLEEVSPEKVLALVQELNIPRTLAILLMNRGAGTADEVKIFLQADLSLLHDPFLMAGMDCAVERVIRAIESQEVITVFCDSYLGR